jgi:glycerophosphoryl diester phosphodiesterase
VTKVFGRSMADVALGADGIEIDVRRTVDDHLVVIHDAQVPEGITVAEAMRHDLPWSVPDLEDVLDDCTGLTVSIEVKNCPRDLGWDPAQRVTTLTLDVLDRRGRIDDVIVSCFDVGALALARTRGFPTALLVDAALATGPEMHGFPVHAVADDGFADLVALGVAGLVTRRVADALAAVRSRS